MIETREYLALVAKTLHDEIRIHAPLDELQGHASCEIRVITFGEIYRAHAATSNFTDDLVKPDALANHRATVRLSDRGERRFFQKLSGGFLSRQQTPHLCA